MYFSGKAFNVAHLVPCGCGKGCSLSIRITFKYTYGINIFPSSYVHMNRLVGIW